MPGRRPSGSIRVEVVGVPELVGALAAPRPSVRVAVEAKGARIRLPSNRAIEVHESRVVLGEARQRVGLEGE
jgi:hypothetical protein